MKKYSVLILAAGLFLASCTDKKEEVKPEPQTGTLSLHFDSRRNATDDFVPNKMYLNANGDSVSLDKFKYFVSNIELIRADGSTFAEPNSYHLIQAGTATTEKEEFEISNIPAGTYSKIHFHVGVDVAHNNSTATQVGDLGADGDMTWDWNTGYMFLVASGKYYDAAAAAPNKYKDFLYTIGKDKSYRTVELSFPAATPTAEIGENHEPEMHLNANVFDIFGGPNTINVKANPILSGDVPEALKVADNYATMFRIDHIHTH